jgi:hypothetical protein
MTEPALQLRGRGQPPGTVQYPEIFKLTSQVVLESSKALTASEVVAAVDSHIPENRNIMFRDKASCQTIRKYLKVHVESGTLSAFHAGANQRVTLYCAPPAEIAS